MTELLILIAVIVLLSVLATRFAGKVGMPVLLLFIGLGMFFGVDGPLGIAYDNYSVTEQICAIALVFIMFYGGFGTKWSAAKPVAAPAIVLSSLGVLVTAGVLGLFCHIGLGLGPLESFLVGAVLSSTDAASVFSILRSKSLSLRYGTDSLLEIESGSNDPVSFMLTTVAIMLLTGENRPIGLMIAAQIGIAAAVGVGTALLAVWLLRRSHLVVDGMQNVFMIAVVLVSYAVPDLLGGNGYLSVYLTGIIMGNSCIRHKDVLVPFFDGITNLAQITIFFLLGLLATPSSLGTVILPAMGIALFLTLVGRPAAVFLLMHPFGICLKEKLLISWAGLRGASSIVFAILAMSRVDSLGMDVFHIVFMVSLLSVAAQGTLLPQVAKRLDMIDAESDVRKTFTDYQDESALTMMRMYIPEHHPWAGMPLSRVHMPDDTLALMIKREGETLIPKGDTMILPGDDLILSIPAYQEMEDIHLEEIPIGRDHEWCDRSIEELELPETVLLAIIKRGHESIIPRGQTVIKEGDVVVVYH